MKENGFPLKKKQKKKTRSKRHPEETITNVDDGDDLALRANTLTQFEYPLLLTGSNITSRESNVNIYIGKALAAIYWLSIK